MLDCVDAASSGENTFSTHCDSVRYTNCVVLPCQHVVVQDVLLDFLPEIQHYPNISMLRRDYNMAYITAFAFVYSQCMLQNHQYHGNGSEGYTDLQGLPSHQTLAIPTWGCVFIASRDGTPAAYSIAYATEPLVNGCFNRRGTRVANLGSWEVVTGRQCG